MAQRQVDDEGVGHVLVEAVVHDVHHDGHVQDHAQERQGRVLDEEEPVDRLDGRLQDRPLQLLHVQGVVLLPVEEVGDRHGVLVMDVLQVVPAAGAASSAAAASTAAAASKAARAAAHAHPGAAAQAGSSDSRAGRQSAAIAAAKQGEMFGGRHLHRLEIKSNKKLLKNLLKIN